MGSVLQIDWLADLDLSWAAKLLSLFLLPLADEDIAVAFGSYFVVNKSMPIGLVAITVYCGIVVSDFAMYGIGAAARSIKWLDRLAVSERVRTFAGTLSRNQFELVAICRVVPGLELIAVVACGWMRVPFGTPRRTGCAQAVAIGRKARPLRAPAPGAKISGDGQKQPPPGAPQQPARPTVRRECRARRRAR